MPDKKYDLIVIGGGSAGSTVAKHMARRDRRVALIEKDKLGGTCLNYGCDPTKALLRAADLLHQMQNCERFGLHATNPGDEWRAVHDRLRKLIDDSRGGSHRDAVARQERRGIDVYLGAGSFESPHVVRAGDDRLEGETIVIAVGYRPAIPEIPGLTEAGFITNREAVLLEPKPKAMAILGGGPVGVEFAQIFSRFGVAVTLLEKAPRILPKDDDELAMELEKILSAEGIRIECGVNVQKVEANGDTKTIHWMRDGVEMGAPVDVILVAAGRRPEFDELNLEAAGVETNKGGLVVDGRLRTSVPHIRAAGDVTGALPFTHVASAQAHYLVHHMDKDAPPPFDYTGIPWVTYTSPALAHVGKTERELREEGIEYGKADLPMEKVPRNHLDGETEGMVKILVGKDGRILGGHILARRADDLIAPIALAMRAGLRAEQLADTVLAYPSSAQAVQFVSLKL